MGQGSIAKRITGACAAAILTLGLALPAPARAETLAGALAQAYITSGLLEQNRALLRAADEEVAVRVAALRPILNWSGRIRRSFGTSANAQTRGTSFSTSTDTVSLGLNLDFLLFDFGGTRLRVDAAKEAVLSTRADLVSIEQQVLLRAVRAFMNVRRTAEIVALRQSNVRLIQQELQAARDRFEVGEVTRTDVSLAEARLARARANLAVAEGDLAQAIEEYRIVVGAGPDDLTPPAEPPQPVEDPDRALALAVRNHPDIIAAQHDVAFADLNVAVAEAAMKPSVNLRAGWSLTEDFDDEDFSRGGEVSVEAGGPIYRGGGLSALLRQAMARRDASRSQLYVVQQNVQQDLANAYALLRVARASSEASRRQIEAAQMAFEGVREEAKLGARTTLDVLNAEQELLDARAQLISAVADEYIAAYAVLAAMGLLTVDYLDLAVPRYDPSEYYNLVKDAPPLSLQSEKLDRVLRALSRE